MITETMSRKNIIGSHFKQWLEHSKTPFFKYFSLITKNKMDFFAQEQDIFEDSENGETSSKSKVFEELCESLDLNPSKIEKLSELLP